MRTVVVKVKNKFGDWCEPFTVTSAITAIDEVNKQLDKYNQCVDDNDKREIVELVDISVSVQYQNLTPQQIKELKKIETDYVSLGSIHRFEKKNLFSNKDGSDTYECKLCGITGKRKGMGSSGVSVKASIGQMKYCVDYLELIKQAGK